MTLGKRERIVVVAGLGLALVIVLYGYVLAPALERSRLLDRLTSQRRSDLEEMVSLQRQYALHARALAEIKEHWLRADDSFSLFSFLEEQASTLGIKEKIVNIKPRNLVYERYRQFQADVQMEKIPLESLIRYLYRIEHANKPLEVQRLHIRSRPPHEGALNVTMLVSIIQEIP